ncbi:MAG: hypothetical protein ACI8SE_001139, partial [Bacteroidia bacterium]
MLHLIVIQIKKLSVLLLFLMCGGVQAQSQLPAYKWTPIGPLETPVNSVDSGIWTANGVGWIEHVTPAHKKEKWLYAGSNVGGMFLSKDRGQTWTFRFDVSKVCGVWDIAVHPKNKKKLWVATATNTWDEKWGHGILYSRNGGKSWKRTGLHFSPPEEIPMYCIERSQLNSKVFYACSATDIFRSDDRTKTWVTVLN